jgi:PAS domain S-box-containing protein
MPDVKDKDEATLMQSVLDALPDAVITITEEGLIASYSQAAERMLGYKAHEVVGMNIKMLMPAPFRDEHDGHMDRYKATKRKNVIGIGREFSAQRKDGTVFPIHLSVSEMFVQGRRMFTGIIRDQSRLKEAEGRERQFSQIVESVSNEVHILDPETLTVLHSNLAAQLNLGYALEEVSNLHPWEFVKGFREEYIKVLVGSLRSEPGAIQTFEETLIRKDGSTYPALTKLQLLEVDDQPVLIAVVQDLTELKSARSTGEQLGSILDRSLNEIFMFDADSLKFVQVNFGARKNLGYTSEEFAQLTPVDIKPEMSQQEFERIVEPLRDGSVEVLNFSTIHQRKDGSRYPVDVNLQKTVTDGKTLFVAVIRDLTERTKMIEDLLLRDRAMAEVNSGIVITDAKVGENRIIYTNEAMEKMTGYTKKEMVGRHPKFLHGADRNQPALDRIYAAVAKFLPAREILRNYRKDGSHFMNEVTISPVRNDKGRVTHFISVQTDVTLKLETERRLLHSQKMDAIGQLTGGIAHDINNLLTVIIGNNELLADHLKDDEYALSLLNDASSAAESGAKLTSQLLSFSRQQTLAPKEIDLNELVHKIHDMLGRTLGETISLEVQPTDGSVIAFADPTQVYNALLNLAINARDAMPTGGHLKIEIDVVELDAKIVQGRDEIAPGRYVRLSVSDTGAGMSPETLSRVTEPFFTTKEKGKGTGLGLSMVHGFAEQSGGYLEIISELNQGTCVMLCLPEAGSLEGADEKNSDVASPVEPRAEIILVVEDDALVRRTTVKRLDHLGYQVLQAETGQQALDILANNSKVDLVFTDMVMPGGMSGADLVEEACKLYPRIKCIITSGYTEQNTIPTDGTLWLRKPYKLQEMSQMFRLLLD